MSTPKINNSSLSLTSFLVGFASIYFAIIVFFSSNLPFFWDDILLGSKFAHHFYEDGLGALILRPEFDCGHPPFFGWYMGAMWKLFGRSLAVSHWAIFPFLIGIAYFYVQNARYFLTDKWLPLALAFLLVEPTVAAQASMGTSDIVLLMAYLMASYCILYEKRWGLMLAILLMAAVNLRGIYWAAIFYVFDVIHAYYYRKKPVIPVILPYLPAGILTIIWFYYHLQMTGFMFLNMESSWAKHYGYNWTPFYLFKNTQYLLWRFTDFGRIFIWAFGLIAFVITFIKTKKLTIKQQEIFLILALFFFLFCVTLIPRKSPLMHRYFMYIYLLFALFAITFIQQISSKAGRYFISAILVLGLLTGNLWKYNDRFPTGWDSTLGHLPYFHLKEKMIQYMEDQRINYSQEVATHFPAAASTYFTDLSDCPPCYNIPSVRRKPYKEHHYVLQSNINNDYTLANLAVLNSWELVYEVADYPVYIRLYRNPEFE